MSVTVPGPAPAVAASPPPRPRATLLELLASTDHKRIGLATAATAFAYFLVGGLLALTMRTELARPGLQFLSENSYNELFTIHGSTMFYLFAAPVVIGVGLYFVPLQIGAARIVWPRLALAGYWLFAAAGVLMYSGFLTQQGAASFGWTAYFPLSDSNATPGIGVDFWIIAVVLATLGVLLQAVSLLATIVRLRAPGMTMLRMPLFTWSELVTVFMVITGFPVLIVALTLLYMDRKGASIYSSTPEGAVTYQHLFWFYGHPVVYVVFFPLVGVVGEAIATFSRRRFFGFRVTVISLLLFSAISMSVWAHHMFATNQVSNRYFSLTSTILLVPAGLEYFGFLATMARGRIRLAAPMLFAIGFVLLFLIGGLTGIMVASPPLDYHVHDSYFVVAHFHYTVFGGTVFGLFAAIHYWFPKLTGRLLGERLARLSFALLLVGALVTFLPMFWLGSEGMTRRVADYLPLHDWTFLNTLSTVGAFTLFLGVCAFLVNLARSLRGGAAAGPDPWEGQTLEWATSSPPPRHNFAALPPVRSPTPLLDLREEGRDPVRDLQPTRSGVSYDPIAARGHGAAGGPRRAPSFQPLFAWGVFLAALTAVSVAFFSPDVSTPALLGGSAAFALVLALALAISRRSLQSDGGGADPDASPATVWLALSLFLTAVGAALGLWLALIGAGMSAVGGVAVVRELRAQRGAEREAGLRETDGREAGVRETGAP